MARIVAADLGTANGEAGKVEQLHEELASLARAVESFNDRLIIDAAGEDVDRLKGLISDFSASLTSVNETLATFASACTTANNTISGVMKTDFVDDEKITELENTKNGLIRERDAAQSVIDSFSWFSSSNKWVDWSSYFSALSSRWSLNRQIDDIQKDIDYMKNVMATCASAAGTFEASTSDIVVSVK